MHFIRRATLLDTAAIVALNQSVVAVTSPMDDQGFAALFAMSAICDVVAADQRVLGFVLTMQQGADYANGNFAWFAQRLGRFAYIDRVVIAAEARGLGLGTMLYDHVARTARMQGSLILAAEIDQTNTGSIAFHARHGFLQLGARELENGKTVSMQIKPL